MFNFCSLAGDLLNRLCELPTWSVTHIPIAPQKSEPSADTQQHDDPVLKPNDQYKVVGPLSFDGDFFTTSYYAIHLSSTTKSHDLVEELKKTAGVVDAYVVQGNPYAITCKIALCYQDDCTKNALSSIVGAFFDRVENAEENTHQTTPALAEHDLSQCSSTNKSPSVHGDIDPEDNSLNEHNAYVSEVKSLVKSLYDARNDITPAKLRKLLVE